MSYLKNCISLNFIIYTIVLVFEDSGIYETVMGLACG
jgi:hypothetical protein